jgi:hypothetical protein
VQQDSKVDKEYKDHRELKVLLVPQDQQVLLV